jgi:putative RecB family exonuclease
MSFDDPTLEPGDDALIADQALFEVEGSAVAMPRHLSPSSASLFDQCPKRWRLRYIDRIPEPPGIAALVGTFAHRVLEVLLGEPAARRTVDRARQIAREAWPETERNPEFRSLELTEAQSRDFRWQGWRAIEGLWTVEDPATVEVAATERQVRAEIGGVPFLGVVDRLDRCPDGLVVTDYKSGSPPSARFADDKLTQVLLYAAAVAAADGEAPVRARLVYLGARAITAEATPDAIAASVAGLRATWDRLGQATSTDTFDPQPGPLCAWCPHVASCDAGLDEVRRRHTEGRVRNDAPAYSLVA